MTALRPVLSHLLRPIALVTAAALLIEVVLPLLLAAAEAGPAS